MAIAKLHLPKPTPPPPEFELRLSRDEAVALSTLLGHTSGRGNEQHLNDSNILAAAFSYRGLSNADAQLWSIYSALSTAIESSEEQS